MNENARKLVAALRSGEYTQGKGYLRLRNDYCCLGVACDIYRKETGQGEWINNSFEPNYWSFKIGDQELITILPNVVQEWLGFSSVNGEFLIEEGESEYDHTDALIDRNDNGTGFMEIADLIESEPKDLFK